MMGKITKEKYCTYNTKIPIMEKPSKGGQIARCSKQTLGTKLQPRDHRTDYRCAPNSDIDL